MAWMWWLLAPLASTVVGGVMVCWPSRQSAPPRRTGAAMREHQLLLRALADQHPADPQPLTMRLLDDAYERPAGC